MWHWCALNWFRDADIDKLERWLVLLIATAPDDRVFRLEGNRVLEEHLVEYAWFYDRSDGDDATY